MILSEIVNWGSCMFLDWCDDCWCYVSLLEFDWCKCIELASLCLICIVVVVNNFYLFHELNL